MTAVNSAILVLAALHDADQVVFSMSARPAMAARCCCPMARRGSQPPVVQGWEFSEFAACVREHVAADLRYYSLLRPLSSWRWRQFAKIDRYDAVFSTATATFTCWANARRRAGAGSARNASSCFWRWRRSCPNRA